MKSDFLRNDNEQQETRETEEKKASLHLNDFAVRLGSDIPSVIPVDTHVLG